MLTVNTLSWPEIGMQMSHTLEDDLQLTVNPANTDNEAVWLLSEDAADTHDASIMAQAYRIVLHKGTSILLRNGEDYGIIHIITAMVEDAAYEAKVYRY